MKVQGLAVIAAALLCAAAVHAEEPTFQFLPEPELQLIVARAAQPVQPRDAFAGLAQCAVADAHTFAPVSAEQAIKMLKPCVDAVGVRYGQKVRLETLTGAAGAFTAQVEGLALYVPEQLGVMSPLVRDLDHALARRHGRILGQPVVVRRAAAPSADKPVTTPSAMTISALQRTIDACFTTQVVRRIATSEDFIASYGRCIESDPALRVSAIRPAVNRPLGVLLQSQAAPSVIRTLNGQVRVAGPEGAVQVSVTAYPAAEMTLP